MTLWCGVIRLLSTWPGSILWKFLKYDQNWNSFGPKLGPKEVSRQSVGQPLQGAQFWSSAVYGLQWICFSTRGCAVRHELAQGSRKGSFSDSRALLSAHGWALENFADLHSASRGNLAFQCSSCALIFWCVVPEALLPRALHLPSHIFCRFVMMCLKIHDVFNNSW